MSSSYSTVNVRPRMPDAGSARGSASGTPNSAKVCSMSFLRALSPLHVRVDKGSTLTLLSVLGSFS